MLTHMQRRTDIYIYSFYHGLKPTKNACEAMTSIYFDFADPISSKHQRVIGIGACVGEPADHLIVMFARQPDLAISCDSHAIA